MKGNVKINLFLLILRKVRYVYEIPLKHVTFALLAYKFHLSQLNNKIDQPNFHIGFNHLLSILLTKIVTIIGGAYDGCLPVVP